MTTELADECVRHANMIEDYLQLVDAMRQALRERTMIYQADLKDKVAVHYQLDRFELYNMAYSDWSVLRDKYIAECNPVA